MLAIGRVLSHMPSGAAMDDVRPGAIGSVIVRPESESDRPMSALCLRLPFSRGSFRNPRLHRLRLNPRARASAYCEYYI